MEYYDIIIFASCILLILLILIGVSRNILTEYGIGILIGILVFGIIGYSIFVNVQDKKFLKKVDGNYNVEKNNY
jgi:hypothetical protein